MLSSNLNDKYFKRLINLVQKANDYKNSIVSTGLIFNNERIETNILASSFIQVANKEKESLLDDGIEIYLPNKSNKKFFLYLPEENCLIRFGKMDKKCHMSKKHQECDKNFANQQFLFPEFSHPVCLHLGYILGQDRISIDDIILAKPINIDENEFVIRMSELEINPLFTINNYDSMPANKTLLSKLHELKSQESQKSV